MKNVRKEDYKYIERMLYGIDPINGFIREGNMAVAGAEAIIPESELLVKEFLEDDKSYVGFFRDWHPKNATEFRKFPPHAKKYSHESELVDELRKYESMAVTYFKNSRSGIFAPGFIDDIISMVNLKEVILFGLCSDKCVMDFGIPLVNLFDELNRNVSVIVPTNVVDTYDAPNHNRDEYNKMAFRFMEEEGIKIVKKYEMKRGK